MMSDGTILLAAGLEILTTLGFVAFWIMWLRQKHDEAWLPEGYVQHERTFLLPDATLATLLLVSAALLLTHHPLGRPLSLFCAGMLAFLALLDTAYFWQTGLFTRHHRGPLNAAIVAALLAISLSLFILLT